MKETRILGICLQNRQADAGEVQQVLTKYGCSIKTRLGLHEVDTQNCSSYGLIILQLGGDSKHWPALEKELSHLPGVKVQHMNFKV